MFPELLRLPVAGPVNAFVDWLVLTHGATFEAVADALLTVLVAIEQGLRWLPWWVVVLAVAALAWHALRRVAPTVGVAAAMVLIGLFGVWEMAMQTLTLVIVACAISALLGVPAGVLLSRCRRLRAIALPVLDAMQTMPSFVYLVPALMLFGLGKVPAVFATVIYAVPPLIRLTDLGIRQVDREIVEASEAFGATPARTLFRIQLPLAMPSIMAGLNQTTMMALSMVVVASMIGARGLGEEVLLGIQRLDVGRGTEAGLAIVALAVVIDRVTQAYGRRAGAGG